MKPYKHKDKHICQKPIDLYLTFSENVAMNWNCLVSSTLQSQVKEK